MAIRSMDDVYEDPWLRAPDLGGSPKVVEIERWDTTEWPSKIAGEPPVTEIVLHYVGAKKKHSLNMKRARKVAKIIGSVQFDDWIGCRLKLVPSKFGEIEYIDVDYPPQAKAAPARSLNDIRRSAIPDEIPFNDSENPGDGLEDVPF